MVHRTRRYTWWQFGLMPSHGVIELLSVLSLWFLVSMRRQKTNRKARNEKKKSLRLVYISIVRSRHHVIDLYFYSNVLFFLRCRVCTWDVNRLLHLHWRLPHPLPMSTINPSDRTWKVDLKLTRLFCSFNYFICHLIGQCSCLVKFVKNLISIQVTCKHFPSINLTFS